MRRSKDPRLSPTRKSPEEARKGQFIEIHEMKQDGACTRSLELQNLTERVATRCGGGGGRGGGESIYIPRHVTTTNCGRKLLKRSLQSIRRGHV